MTDDGTMGLWLVNFQSTFFPHTLMVPICQVCPLVVHRPNDDTRVNWILLCEFYVKKTKYFYINFLLHELLLIISF